MSGDYRQNPDYISGRMRQPEVRDSVESDRSAHDHIHPDPKPAGEARIYFQFQAPTGEARNIVVLGETDTARRWWAVKIETPSGSLVPISCNIPPSKSAIEAIGLLFSHAKKNGWKKGEKNENY